MTGGPARATGALRASDAERERVVGKLEREFAAGRLSMPELEQRTGAAQDARTREQLRALTLDLPPDLVPVQTTAAAPDHCLLCVLLCVCPPAGLVYWLACRHAAPRDLPPGEAEARPLLAGVDPVGDRARSVTAQAARIRHPRFARVFDRMSPAIERAMLALSERQSGAASARARAAAMIDASDGWPEKPPVVR